MGAKAPIVLSQSSTLPPLARMFLRLDTVLLPAAVAVSGLIRLLPASKAAVLAAVAPVSPVAAPPASVAARPVPASIKPVPPVVLAPAALPAPQNACSPAPPNAAPVAPAMSLPNRPRVSLPKRPLPLVPPGAWDTLA